MSLLPLGLRYCLEYRSGVGVLMLCSPLWNLSSSLNGSSLWATHHLSKLKKKKTMNCALLSEQECMNFMLVSWFISKWWQCFMSLSDWSWEEEWKRKCFEKSKIRRNIDWIYIGEAIIGGYKSDLHGLAAAKFRTYFSTKNILEVY